MIAKLHLLIFALLFTLPTQPIASTTLTGDKTCQRVSNFDCLKNFIDREVGQLDTSNKDNSLIKFHWQFEKQVHKNQALKIQTEANKQKIKAQLFQEERFLDSISATQENTTLSEETKKLNPFLDSLHILKESLLIEQHTLSLQDKDSDEIKRTLIEKALSLKDEDRFNAVILQAARSEIISGAPDKGQNTLNTAQINEFSDALLVYEKQFTFNLIELSRKLFLDPTFNKTRCQNDENPTTTAINTLLSGQTISLLSLINQTPSLDLQTKLNIDLIRMHIYSESCPLLISLLTQQLIKKEIKHYKNQQKTLLSLIYFSRSVRRYLSI